jgi:lipopolysaccharide transport system ATP-binding protein
MTPAVRCVDVGKSYRLYQSISDLALDRLGLGVLVKWRRGAYPADFEALKAIDLSVQPGERVGIIGRNGAGKTTLLRLIVGAATGNFAPSSGRIEVAGKIQALMRTGLGFHPEFSGLENVRSALIYNGLSGLQLNLAIDDVLDFAELGSFIDRPMSTYSLGMTTRLQFAVATAISPEILVIDEVLGAGDAYFARKSEDRMRRLAHSGCTLLLVSHSIRDVLGYCERAIWLDQGRIVRDGPAAEVVGAYGALDYRTGSSQGKKEWRAFLPRASELEENSFIERMIAGAEGFQPFVGLPVRLPSGRKAARRVAVSGAAIGDVRMRVKSAEEGVLKVDDAAKVEVDVAFQAGFRSPIVCVLSLFTADGVCVTQLASGPIVASGGLRRTVEISLDPIVLGARDYFGTIALVDQATPADWSRAYDVLSKVVHLPVANVNDTNPPLLHYPARWWFGDASQPVAGRLSSFQ